MDNNKLLDRLPHKARMLLIDKVLQVDGVEAVTETDFGPGRSWLMMDDQSFPIHLGVELIAQTSALSLIMPENGAETHSGMIIQVRSFQVYQSPARWPIRVRTRAGVNLVLGGRVATVIGEVHEGDRILCRGVLTLSVQ